MSKGKNNGPQNFTAAKEQLVAAANTAGFALMGKAANHPLGRKALGALFAPKSAPDKPKAGQGRDPISNLVNSAIVVGADALNWLNIRKNR